MAAGGSPNTKRSSSLEMIEMQMKSPVDHVLGKLRRGNSKQHYGRGHRGRYLGRTKTVMAGGDGCTNRPVSRLLAFDEYMGVELDEIYLDVKPLGLIMYFVDEDSRITRTKLFDLARISYCSGDHAQDSRVFAWIYRQETENGFQLECHAVRLANSMKAKLLSVHMCQAFDSFYNEIQAALKTSQLLNKASGADDELSESKTFSPERQCSAGSNLESCCNKDDHHSRESLATVVNNYIYDDVPSLDKEIITYTCPGAADSTYAEDDADSDNSANKL